MADITMCDNKECSLRLVCYRYNAEPCEIRQTYLMYPDKDCIDQNYLMFWDYIKGWF